MAQRHVIAIGALIALVATGCEEAATAVADASLYRAGGQVLVNQGGAKVAATEGMKLKPDDVIEIGADSLALVLCGNGYLVKLGAETNQTVSRLDACTLEPTSESPEDQRAALLSPSEIPLLGAGERVAAADARIKGGVSGTTRSVETADEAAELQAASDVEGSEAPADEPVAVARKENAAEEAKAPPPPKPGRRAAQAEAPNDQARRLLASGKTKGGGMSASSAKGDGTKGPAPTKPLAKPIGGLTKAPLIPGFAGTTNRAPVLGKKNDSLDDKREVGDAEKKSKSKLGLTGRKTSPALELTKLVNRDAGVRKCLAAALPAKADALTLSVTVKDGKIQKVSITGAKSQPACLSKTMGGRTLAGVDDGTFTHAFSRSALTKK